MDDGTKKIIISIGAAIAIVPLVISAIGGIITAVTTLQTAITFLAANPIVLGIMAVVAAAGLLTGALVKAKLEANNTATAITDIPGSSDTSVTITKETDFDTKVEGIIKTLEGLGANKEYGGIAVFKVPDGLIGEIDKYSAALAAAATATGDYKAAAENLNSIVDNNAAEKINAINAQAAESAGKLTRALNDGVITQKEYDTKLAELQKTTMSAKDEVNRQADAQKALNNQFSDGNASNDVEAWKTALTTAYAGVGLSQQDVIDSTNALTNAVKNNEDMNKYWVDGAIAAKGLKDSAVDAYNNLQTATDTYNTSMVKINADEKAFIDAQNTKISNSTLLEAATTRYTDLVYAGVDAEEAMTQVVAEYPTVATQAKEALTTVNGELETNYSTLLDICSKTEADTKVLQDGIATGTQKFEDDRVAAKQAYVDAINKLGEGLSTEQKRIVLDMVDSTGRTVTDGDRALILGVGTTVDTIKSKVAEGGTAVVDEVATAVKEVDKKKVDAEKSGSNVGEAIVTGMISGIDSKSSELYRKVTAMVNAAIAKGKEAAEVNSPSKKMAREVGAPLAEGVTVGFESGIDPMLASVKKNIGKIIATGSGSAKAALAQAKAGAQTLTNKATTINQTNNFTSRTLSAWEQQQQIRRMNKDLAGAFV